MIHSGDIHVTSGKVIIIPYTNWCGWLTGKRSVPTKGANKDLNRHFIVENPTGLAKEILVYVKQADYVLDLHESKHYYQDRLGEDLYNGRTLWSNKHRLTNEKVKMDINETVYSGPPFILDIGTAKPFNNGMLQDYCLVHDIPYLLVETCKKDSLEERVLQNKAAIRSMIHNITGYHLDLRTLIFGPDDFFLELPGSYVSSSSSELISLDSSQNSFDPSLKLA